MPKLVHKQRKQAEVADVILQLSTLGYEPPNVGIFDEPTRCYRLNSQWAKIVFGWLDWLVDEQCWSGTDEQKFNAVRELEKFLIPQNCGEGGGMTDCEGCFDDPNFLALLNNAIDNALADVVPDADQPMAAARREDNLLPETAETCEVDTLFGIITGLVDYLHNTALDILQIWEFATNSAELAASLIENVPVLGQIASEVIGYADWILENLSEQYIAAFTATSRDTLRCALFCNAQEGCSLTLDDIFSTYAAYATVDISGVTSLQAVLDRMTAISADADIKVVALFHWFIMSALRYGSSFYGIDNLYSLATAMELSANNPDPDHEILCTTCPRLFWEHTSIFSAGLNGWQVQLGSLTAGEIKWAVTGGNRGVTILLQFPESVKVRGVEFIYRRVNATGGSATAASFRLRPIIGSNQGSTFLWIQSDPVGTNSLKRCAVRSVQSGTFLTKECVLAIGNEGNVQGEIYVQSVRLWGELTPNPPGGQETDTQPQCTP